MSKDYKPSVGHIHVTDVRRITVQADLEHGCIDIMLIGSESYLKSRISIWAHEHWDSKDIPVVEMLPDVPAKEPDNAETDA